MKKVNFSSSYFRSDPLFHETDRQIRIKMKRIRNTDFHRREKNDTWQYLSSFRIRTSLRRPGADGPPEHSTPPPRAGQSPN